MDGYAVAAALSSVEAKSVKLRSSRRSGAVRPDTVRSPLGSDPHDDWRPIGRGADTISRSSELAEADVVEILAAPPREHSFRPRGEDFAKQLVIGRANVSPADPLDARGVNRRWSKYPRPTSDRFDRRRASMSTNAYRAQIVNSSAYALRWIASGGGNPHSEVAPTPSTRSAAP